MREKETILLASLPGKKAAATLYVHSSMTSLLREGISLAVTCRVKMNLWMYTFKCACGWGWGCLHIAPVLAQLLLNFLSSLSLAVSVSEWASETSTVTLLWRQECLKVPLRSRLDSIFRWMRSGGVESIWKRGREREEERKVMQFHHSFRVCSMPLTVSRQWQCHMLVICLTHPIYTREEGGGFVAFKKETRHEIGHSRNVKREDKTRQEHMDVSAKRQSENEKQDDERREREKRKE